MLNVRRLDEALTLLGALLDERGQRADVLVVGGSALLLHGVVDRPTADVDVVALLIERTFRKADVLPADLRVSIAEVGAALGLSPTWLNTGPSALMDLGLPDGFAGRLEKRMYGGLTVHLAGREDLIALKLYAFVDQGPASKHRQDLVALQPTSAELRRAARWARSHDPSDAFRTELRAALALLGIEDGDERR